MDQQPTKNPAQQSIKNIKLINYAVTAQVFIFAIVLYTIYNSISGEDLAEVSFQIEYLVYLFIGVSALIPFMIKKLKKDIFNPQKIKSNLIDFKITQNDGREIDTSQMTKEEKITFLYYSTNMIIMAVASAPIIFGLVLILISFDNIKYGAFLMVLGFLYQLKSLPQKQTINKLVADVINLPNELQKN